MKILSALLFLVPALAGCLSSDEDGTASGNSGSPTAQPEAFGSLLVVVVTPDLVPIEGANVTAGNQTLQSDVQGGARFEELRAGVVSLQVRKDGFRPGDAEATVKAAQETTARVKLIPGIDGPSGPKDEKKNYTEDFSLNGYFDCSATYLIVTGDCLLVVDYGLDAANSTTTKELDTSIDPRPGVATNEQFLLEFPLDADWTHVDVIMDWTSITPLGDQMTLAIEPAQAPADGHSAKYAVTDGGSPLTLRLEAGKPHANATSSADGEKPDMPNAGGGEVLRTRSYVQGFLHRPGGTGFLGVGATVLQRFQVLVTVHYDPSDDAEGGSA